MDRPPARGEEDVLVSVLRGVPLPLLLHRLKISKRLLHRLILFICTPNMAMVWWWVVLAAVVAARLALAIKMHLDRRRRRTLKTMVVLGSGATFNPLCTHIP